MHAITHKTLVLSALLIAICPGFADAAITVYTTRAAFLAATSTPGVDMFTGFSITGTTASPITRSAGAYTYTGTASTSTFFGAGTTANPWLSTNLATDTVTFSGFTGSPAAVGGNFLDRTSTGCFWRVR